MVKKYAFLAVVVFALLRGQSKPDFSRDVQPIFARACYGCHGPESRLAGVRLDSRASALAKVIRPGKSTESVLLTRVNGQGGQPRMPMGGKLDTSEIAVLQRWIDSGAEWPDTGEAADIKRHW